jgi:hypothetical protein
MTCLLTVVRWKAFLFAAMLPAVSAAATYTHTFNSLANNTPNGATNTVITLGGGTLNGAAANATLISSRRDTNGAGAINVGVVRTGVGAAGDTALRLADRATSSAAAALVLPVLDANAAVTEFTVTLRLLMDRTAGATPADGFNISFGPALSGPGGATGHLSGYGLVVNFDTFENSASDPRSIEVFADGNSVGNFPARNLAGGNFTFDQTFRTVTLRWDAVNGLDLTYDGVAIFTRLPTPGFVPTVGSNFALNAATGGSTQDVFIDDLVVTTGVTPPAPIVTGGVVIEEIMADNASGLEDEDLDRPDWIDLYNGTAAPVSLAGWRLDYTSAPIPAPGTTPPPASYALPAVTIPAFGHLVVFASGKDRFTNVRPHTNFTLQKEGGTLTLVRADGAAVHALTYGAQQEDVSFGGQGAAQTAGYFEIATPGATNSGRQAAGRRLGAPVFFKPDAAPLADQPSAVITAAITLGIQLPANAPADAEIRYTLNTAEPSETSTLYTAPLAITTGTCVKARVFAPGYVPSKTGNRAFIWLSGAANTNATTLVNVATNYNGSGQPFSSNLPVIVLDSYLRNVDALTNPLGLRPYRFSQVAVYDVKPGTNRASFANAPDQVLRAGTHVRGQSSASQTERPYALEFWKEDEDIDRTEPLLGMPSHSDWVLMSLTLDKSLMRNYLMQQAMLDANGPGAGVRCRFVEVFFNQGNGTLDYGDYRGVYLLMEKPSRGKERVDIAKLNDSMSDPALISGGYILKNDKLPYERQINAAANPAIPGANRDYDIYDPEPVTTTQANALVDWLNRMTTALAAPDFNQPASANYYGKWIHERSFIDKTLWYELCKEVDAYIYSYYFSKDRNGPLTAFPLWDVDRSLGNANYNYANSTFGMKWWAAGSNYTYYPRLHTDPEFNDRYWNRWTALRRSHFAKQTLFDRIEAVYTLLTDGNRAAIVTTANATTMAVQVPAARHYRKYPNLGSNTFPGGQAGQANRTTWRQEVDALKSWLAERLEWMDGAPETVDATTLAPRLKPTELLDAVTGQPHYGGNVPLGFQFRIHNPNPAGGTTYYTIDGVDPRQVGGALDASALTATTGTVAATPLLAAGQTWKWLLPAAAPANDADGLSWTATAYADGAWSTGAAPLGYGETAGLATNVAPTAPNYTAANVEPGAAYFRTTFNVTGTTGLTSAFFEIMADDGAVIYLNGVEAARINFPLAPTPATYGQEALGPIDPGDNYAPLESLFVAVPFDRALLKEGVNTLAVEVHQAIYSFPPNPTNAYPRNDFADMRFDLRIVGQTTSAPGPAVAFETAVTRTVRTRIKNGNTWSPLTEATFVLGAAPASAANLVVTELHYHPADPTPAELAAGFNDGNDFEFIELMNISRTQSVDLSGVKLDDAVTFDFGTVAPPLRILPPGGRIVVVENLGGFASRLEPGATPVVVGAFSGNLSNSNEQLIVRAADGTIIKQFTYRDSSPWPAEADGNGAEPRAQQPVHQSEPRAREQLARESAGGAGEADSGAARTARGDAAERADGAFRKRRHPHRERERQRVSLVSVDERRRAGGRRHEGHAGGGERHGSEFGQLHTRRVQCRRLRRERAGATRGRHRQRAVEFVRAHCADGRADAHARCRRKRRREERAHPRRRPRVDGVWPRRHGRSETGTLQRRQHDGDGGQRRLARLARRGVCVGGCVRVCGRLEGCGVKPGSHGAVHGARLGHGGRRDFGGSLRHRRRHLAALRQCLRAQPRGHGRRYSHRGIHDRRRRQQTTPDPRCRPDARDVRCAQSAGRSHAASSRWQRRGHRLERQLGRRAGAHVCASRRISPDRRKPRRRAPRDAAGWRHLHDSSVRREQRHGRGVDRGLRGVLRAAQRRLTSINSFRCMGLSLCRRACRLHQSLLRLPYEHCDRDRSCD